MEIEIVNDWVVGRYFLFAWPCCQNKQLNEFFMNMSHELPTAIGERAAWIKIS